MGRGPSRRACHTDGSSHISAVRSSASPDKKKQRCRRWSKTIHFFNGLMALCISHCLHRYPVLCASPAVVLEIRRASLTGREHGRDGKEPSRATPAAIMSATVLRPGPRPACPIAAISNLIRRAACRLIPGHFCMKTKTPFLFAPAMSILPSPFRSAVSNCVPRPESSSIRCLESFHRPSFFLPISNQ